MLITCIDRAEAWAEGVRSGKIVSGLKVKQAVERYYRDLKSYELDAVAVERACNFIEALPHTKGKWASKRELLKLEGWQCFAIANIFGFKNSEGKRRYRRALIRVARKNGKSAFAAAIGVYMAFADGEHGAEVYSGATSEDQAWEVFRPARLMVKKTPKLAKTLGIEVNAKSLFKEKDGSLFRPVIGKPGDGASPSCAITDEYHEHKTDDLLDTMETGMGARDEPLSLIVTTAGSLVGGPCHQLDQDASNILAEIVKGETFFALVFEADPDDDWTSDEALLKANPNIGVSVSWEYLRTRRDEAVSAARKQNTFKVKHLNQWVNASVSWLSMVDWKNCADAPDISEFVGCEFWSGLDLASKLDLTAKVKIFKKEVDGLTHYYAYSSFYLPERQVEQPENQHYQGWSVGGFLEATDGDHIDYDKIREDLLSDRDDFDLVELRHDPYGAAQLAQELAAEGVLVTEVPQRAAHLSEPMKWLEALVVAGRLHHDNNPVMEWCISNVMVKRFQDESIFPRKERAENKIDGAVAAIMALSGAMSEEEPETQSVYEDRDMRFI